MSAPTTPVRWGVLGAANIALTRTIPAMCAAPSATPFAIASTSWERGAAAASRFGFAQVYQDYDALLADPDVEAVYIPNRNVEHFESCLRAMRAGKHVMCEKPLVLSSGEVERLIAVRDETGRLIEEAFSYRNHPQWRDIAAFSRDGRIGAPRAAHGVLAKQFLDPKDIRNDPEAGGGALYDLGCYPISAMNQVFGRSPQRVFASMDFDPAYGVDRLTTAILDYGDAQATFTVGIRSGPATATHQQFSVLGERGWLMTDLPFAHPRPTECHLRIGDDQSLGAFPASVITYEPVDQYGLQVERFSRAVRGETADLWPIEDSLLILRIIEAIQSAADLGRAVEVDPPRA